MAEGGRAGDKKKDKKKKTADPSFFLPRTDNGIKTMTDPNIDITTAERILAALGRIEKNVADNGNAIADVRGQLLTLTARVTGLEDTADRASAEIKDLSAKCAKTAARADVTSAEIAGLVKTNMNLQKRVEVLENNMRSARLRILGLPPDIEGEDPAKFLFTLFTTLFASELRTEPLYVESGYRLKSTVLPNGTDGAAGPTMIAVIPDSADKDWILNCVRKCSTGLCYDGHKIHVFPDLAPETMQRRKRLQLLKKKFIENGIQAGLMYPAKLRITHANKEYMFTDPSGAEALLLSLPCRTASPATT